MKRFKLNILMIVFFLSIYTTSTIHGYAKKSIIEGTVIDAKTHEPLIGVNVFIEHTTIGAATDENGKYIISMVPVGEVRVIASIIGYEVGNKLVKVVAGERIRVDFELNQTILEMGAVVVTGTATPHLIKDVPVRTEVIPRRMIEQKQACNLAEALSFHTGIRVENNCQNCNFTQVRILGMEGKYSQILIDGDPVVSSLASVYGLEHFPEEMIDRIEIVKGGGSSLYGGGAVAGVVNMITRSPSINQVKVIYSNNSTGGKIDHRIGFIAETANEDGTSGAYVFGSMRQRTPYDHNGDGFSELGQLKNESLGFKCYYKPIATGELLASFHRIYEERRGGNKFNLPVHEAEIAEWTEHWRSGGTIRWNHRPTAVFDYRVYYSFSIENRKSYYGGLKGKTDEDRLDALSFYGRTENPLHILGLQANYELGNHLITGGIQYSRDKLNDETAAESAYHVNAEYINTGIFIQDNIYFGKREKIELVLGVRVDKHSELNHWIYSPRVNGKFNLGNGIALRAAYTTGFKPPQIYDEDLHLCGIQGDQRIVRNSPDLREERSRSMILGLEFQGYLKNIPMMISVTTFMIRLDDVFTQKFISKVGVTEQWERVNSKGGQVEGVELDLGIRPVTNMEIRSGMTYKKSRYDEKLEDFNTKNFLRMPELTGNFRLTFDATERFSFYFGANYIGSAYVPHEVVVEGQENPELILTKSSDFVQIDLGVTWSFQFSGNFKTALNMGIKNVTNAYQRDLDKGPDRDPAYVYGPIRPRTFYIGFETTF